MGIKHLNKFLKESCPKSISYLSLSELNGKKIAIDISIYMYKFAAENCLIENMYLMLTVFRHYNITPIFIFDGRPPEEKKALLQKRKDDKKEAYAEYSRLKQQIQENSAMDDDDKQDVMNNMDVLKRQFITINKRQVDSVKDLIRCYGATYYDAPGEADELCAMLVIKKKVWACMSEDMDMFVYGCTRVLRYFSLINYSVICYDTKAILEELNMSQNEFRQICVLSGTDYNYNAAIDSGSDVPNLLKTMKMFHKYRSIQKRESMCDLRHGFYCWLLENSSYIEDIELLKSIYDVFDINDKHINIKIFEKIKIVNGPIIKDRIKDILQDDGFIYPVAKM